MEQMRTKYRIALFADIDFNLIDGSTIWLQSVAQVLASLPFVRMQLILRNPIQRDILHGPVLAAGVTIISPHRDRRFETADCRPLSPRQLITALKILDEEEPLSAIIIRGKKYAAALARDTSLCHRMWSYLLDFWGLLDSGRDPDLVDIISRSRNLIVQSELHRALLETAYPLANGKTAVLPPMVPSTGKAGMQDRSLPRELPIRLIYAGKFSHLWNVESYFDLPQLGQVAAIPIEVVMLGDKVHKERTDPDFGERFSARLIATPQVQYCGGKSREETLRIADSCHFGLCWRRPEVDENPELSTKFIEFATLGIPTFLNRASVYERLLGEDYPYFVASAADIISAISRSRQNAELYRDTSKRCANIAREFTFDRARDRLRRLIDLTPVQVFDSRRTVVIAGHDLKFLRALASYWKADPTLDIRYDKWASTTVHDPKRSEQLLRVADLIFCEWCAEQAVYYSQRKQPHQQLIIRLHRFELFTDFPKHVAIDNVDAVVVVNPYMKEELSRQFGWPAEIIHVLPQYVDTADLDRPKLASAARTIGFVGIVGFFHKRFDKAVDVFEMVLDELPDFRMEVRSRLPWEFEWAYANDPAARDAFRNLFRRIETSSRLKAAIAFDPPGSNMAEWYRRIGYFLSTSESEGCHASVAEAMASGALPAVINWPGAERIYPFVENSFEKLAGRILEHASVVDMPTLQERMKTIAREKFDITNSVAFFERLFRGSAVKRREINVE